MRCQHAGRINHGAVSERRLIAQIGRNPHRRQAEGRLVGRLARQVWRLPRRVHHQQAGRPQHAAPGFHFFDPDQIIIRPQLQIILDAHRRHHKAHLARHRPPQAFDLLGQTRLLAAGQAQQPKPQLDPHQIQFQRLRNRRLARRSGHIRRRLARRRLVELHPGAKPRTAGQQQKRHHRHARHKAEHKRPHRRHRQRLRPPGQLFHQRHIRAAFNPAFGDHNTSGDRHQQRRNLAHQPVAHRQRGIGGNRVGHVHAMAQNPGRQPTDNVDRGDNHPGNRIAAHKLRRTIHRAVERGFFFQILAPLARHRLGNGARAKLGINRHLLARHRIQAEPRRHFGDAA